MKFQYLSVVMNAHVHLRDYRVVLGIYSNNFAHKTLSSKKNEDGTLFLEAG